MNDDQFFAPHDMPQYKALQLQTERNEQIQQDLFDREVKAVGRNFGGGRDQELIIKLVTESQRNRRGLGGYDVGKSIRKNLKTSQVPI
eukprot:UN02716